MIYRRAFFKGKMSNKVIMESEFSLANDTTRDLIPSPSRTSTNQKYGEGWFSVHRVFDSLCHLVMLLPCDGLEVVTHVLHSFLFDDMVGHWQNGI